jgi:hypothetical protein
MESAFWLCVVVIGLAALGVVVNVCVAIGDAIERRGDPYE